MAQNNLAYRQRPLEKNYDAQPIPAPRPRLRTIEGAGRGTRAQSQQAPWIRTAVVMCAVLVVVLSTASVARISLTNATVQMMQTAEDTSLAIDQARTVGLDLEVRHSLANSPTRIQDRAATMGVLPARQPATVEARSGFSAETVRQMNAAASEYKAAELSLLQGAEENTEGEQDLSGDVANDATYSFEPSSTMEESTASPDAGADYTMSSRL